MTQNSSQYSWWLDESALPERFLWGRMQVLDNGQTEVLDTDGSLHYFSSSRDATQFLREDEHGRFEEITDEHPKLKGIEPPQVFP